MEIVQAYLSSISVTVATAAAPHCPPEYSVSMLAGLSPVVPQALASRDSAAIHANAFMVSAPAASRARARGKIRCAASRCWHCRGRCRSW